MNSISGTVKRHRGAFRVLEGRGVGTQLHDFVLQPTNPRGPGRSSGRAFLRLAEDAWIRMGQATAGLPKWGFPAYCAHHHPLLLLHQRSGGTKVPPVARTSSTSRTLLWVNASAALPTGLRRTRGCTRLGRPRHRRVCGAAESNPKARDRGTEDEATRFRTGHHIMGSRQATMPQPPPSKPWGHREVVRCPESHTGLGQSGMGRRRLSSSSGVIGGVQHRWLRPFGQTPGPAEGMSWGS